MVKKKKRGRPKGSKNKPKRQTGKSNTRIDKKYKARKVGKRKSASGRVYYETRRNRSDKSRVKRL